MTNKETKQKSNFRTGVSAGASVSKAEPKEAPPVAQKAALSKHLRRNVTGCSACGNDHKNVLFILRKESSRGEYPYAATCPISGKQILPKVSG